MMKMYAQKRFTARDATSFTLIELLVVMLVIIAVLGIGLPAFNTLSLDSQYSQARQTIAGALRRAHVLAISEKNLIAVRICPAEWVAGATGGDGGAVIGRQAIVFYSLRTPTVNPAATNAGNSALYGLERFERIQGEEFVLLPGGVWAAPAESLWASDIGRDKKEGGPVVAGEIGRFRLDPSGVSGDDQSFLDADDFLVVFGPDGGLFSSVTPKAWELSAYIPFDTKNADYSSFVPTNGVETAGRWRSNKGEYDPAFRRFSFTGISLYRRDQFVSAGRNGPTGAIQQARRVAIRKAGLTFLVNPTGGALVQAEGAISQ